MEKVAARVLQSDLAMATVLQCISAYTRKRNGFVYCPKTLITEIPYLEIPPSENAARNARSIPPPWVRD